MLHEKFIEISSVNNLSYQRPFINRFSISKRIRKLVCSLHNSQFTKASLSTFERWCVLSFFSCFIHAHNGSAHCSHSLASDRASITFSDIDEKSVKGAGLRSLAITTCWNLTIIEIYRIAPHRTQNATQLNHVHWQSSARESTAQRNGIWECMSEQWNHSIYHFKEADVESLNFQRAIILFGEGTGPV